MSLFTIRTNGRAEGHSDVVKSAPLGLAEERIKDSFSHYDQIQAKRELKTRIKDSEDFMERERERE